MTNDAKQRVKELQLAELYDRREDLSDAVESLKISLGLRLAELAQLDKKIDEMEGG